MPDRRVLLASLAIQLVLAALLGHSFDTRVFMGTGYLVGTGQVPYAMHDAAGLHADAAFLLGIIGYPPPWPLLAGLLYRVSYAVVPNVVVYNLALKLPMVVATIGLAAFAAAAVEDLGLGPRTSRTAFAWLLLNPMILLTGVAWGQIDVIVALSALAALVTLLAGRRGASALLLALAICVKPIALPLLPAAVVYLWRRSVRDALLYAALTSVGIVVLYIVPFYVFGWSRLPFTQHLNRHFVMAGALSITTVVRAVSGPVLLSGHWWLLGLLWAPALLAAIAVFLRRRDSEDLFRMSLAFVLVVFLTRTWLAEPNVVLLLPLALILTLTGALDRRLLVALWALPLAFAVFNASPLQLLWVASPGAMRASLDAVSPYGETLLAIRAGLVVAWQVVGWWTVVSCVRGRPASVDGTDATVYPWEQKRIPTLVAARGRLGRPERR